MFCCPSLTATGNWHTSSSKQSDTGFGNQLGNKLKYLRTVKELTSSFAINLVVVCWIPAVWIWLEICFISVEIKIICPVSTVVLVGLPSQDRTLSVKRRPTDLSTINAVLFYYNTCCTSVFVIKKKKYCLQYTKSGIGFPVITRSNRLVCYFLSSESRSSFVLVAKQVPVDGRY